MLANLWGAQSGVFGPGYSRHQCTSLGVGQSTAQEDPTGPQKLADWNLVAGQNLRRQTSLPKLPRAH